MADKPLVLVVDDDPHIAGAVRRALIYEGYAVEVAADGRAALDRASERPPDLVVLDLMLPEIDGIEVCRRLRAAGDVPVLMLTARDATADRVRGLDSGADDYLVKPFAYEELLARVRALLRRHVPTPRRTLRYADLVLDLTEHRVTRDGGRVELTPREFDLLHHLMLHPRQVLSRDQLLDAVWGLGIGTASNVVDVYVGYLRDKLDAGGRPQLIQTVRGVGYVLREQ
ncbi:MAG TPA: response regulator transcription factor [Candidatus Dormibacteraeota bacterium]|jgi:two-component system response regulator MprA|nr:response regulator transcription factor [Candidatus Dormibacteraeota bacterium]